MSFGRRGEGLLLAHRLLLEGKEINFIFFFITDKHTSLQITPLWASMLQKYKLNAI
jgi:hypothetical protein